jgi:MoaA/NifB/PqqE/SkfB family radical SAM enzyme
MPKREEPLVRLHRIQTADPATLAPTAAEVVTDGTRVYLQTPGTKAPVLLEEDLVLYQLLAGGRAREKPSVSHLVIEPTYRCNLACPICFTHKQAEDVPLAEIAAEIEKVEGRVVTISGGEPTMREDLPEIIRLVARRNIPLLASNGIRLAERAYLEVLREHGLGHVTFSFNGFSDAAQLGTNGRELLASKLAAIDNLAALDMRFLLSTVLMRGVNEQEIGPILELAARYPRQIKEVRFRSAMPMGKHVELRPFLPSEMLTLICRSAGVARDDVLGALRTYRRLSSLVPFLHLMQKPCSFGFYLRRDGDAFRPLPEGPFWRAARDLQQIFPVGSALFGGHRSSIWRHREGTLKVSVRVWPTWETIDLRQHVTHCNTRYITGHKKGLPVCYANLLHDRGRLPGATGPGVEGRDRAGEGR